MPATPPSSPAHARRRGGRRPLASLIVATVLAAQAVAAAPGVALAAPIGFRSATSTSSPSTTTLQLATPSGTAAGDALLASISVRGKPTIRQPAGWALVLKTQASSTMSQAIYVRVAGDAEPVASTWTFSKAVGAVGGLMAFSGVDPAAPVDVAKGQSNPTSTTITAPSVTTTAAGGLLVAIFGIAQATAITPASTLTERFDANASGTFRISAAAGDERLAAAGATGTRTAGVGASATSIGQLVALRPVVEPPQDTTAPAVIARAPGAGATDVPVDSNVAATFSEGVTGVDGATFSLAGPGAAVDAQVSYSASTWTATLDPATELAPSTTYTATLRGDITDGAGNALPETSWSFQTASASSPPPPPPPPPAGEIAFRSASTGTNAATASLVLPIPSGVQQGDALLAVVTTRGAPVVSAPSGWGVALSTANGTIMQQVVFVHVAGASEPASFTFPFSKAASASGGMLAYSGVDATSPIDAADGAANASSATITAPSITTNTAGGMLVGLFGIARLSTFTAAAGMAERFEVASPSSATYKVSAAADDSALGLAGPTGARSSTGSGAAGNVGQLIALRAAGAPAVAGFDGSPLSGAAPLAVTFTDRSTGSPTSWSWDFDGDGQVDSTARNPTHTYTEPGVYTVGLTIASAGPSDTEIKSSYVRVDAPPDPGAGDPVLVGAGDIAECGGNDDEATAALLDGIDGTVFTLGDNVYETGTVAEWNNCYGPTWGRHKARTRPALGNHDHEVGQPATQYFDYFGANAGDPSKGYYSYDLGGWHIVVLNTECDLAGGCGAASPQVTWLRQDLAADNSACTLAYWHEPLYTSARSGSLATQVFWQALLDDGAEVVLNGDSHVYERFAPQDAAGNSLATGIREFIVGTGGRGLGSFNTVKANSEVRDNSSFGVLKLTLHETGYSWEFVPVAGDTLRDSGSAACH